MIDNKAVPSTIVLLMARRMLMVDEGYRATVYDDITGANIVSGSRVRGDPTIGYGTNLTFPLDESFGRQLLDTRIMHIVQHLELLSYYRHCKTNARRAVLVDMAYNLGYTGLAEFHKMILYIERGDFRSAAKEILDSNAARELPVRYERLSKMMATGVTV